MESSGRPSPSAPALTPHEPGAYHDRSPFGDAFRRPRRSQAGRSSWLNVRTRRARSFAPDWQAAAFSDSWPARPRKRGLGRDRPRCPRSNVPPWGPRSDLAGISAARPGDNRRAAQAATQRSGRRPRERRRGPKSAEKRPRRRGLPQQPRDVAHRPEWLTAERPREWLLPVARPIPECRMPAPRRRPG